MFLVPETDEVREGCCEAGMQEKFPLQALKLMTTSLKINNLTYIVSSVFLDTQAETK